MRGACVRQYGSGVERIVALVEEEPEWAERLAGTTTIWAEVVHAVRFEMALTLGDVVFRRTDLATGSYPGRVVLARVASWMARELAWPVGRADEEVERVVSRFPSWAVDRVDGTITEAAA